MPDLNFQIEHAEAVPYAATPLLHLKTRIRNADPHFEIQSVLLQCQIQIEPARRSYVSAEHTQLRELFGAPARWGQTLRPILWANSQVAVSSFRGNVLADIPVPCTFDFNVAATKYLYGLENGEIPICILFSGTIFYSTEEGLLHVAKIPWDREVNYSLPVSVWKKMIDMYYPNTAWLCLQRDVFDQIYKYKVDRAIITWEQTIESLLAGADGARYAEDRDLKRG